MAGDQHLPLQLDRATRQVRCLFWHGLGELGLQHARPVQHDAVLPNDKDPFVWIAEDLLANTEANAVQAALQRHRWVLVRFADLRVEILNAQALCRLLQDHRLEGVAPAHGLVANVGAFLAVDGVDAVLQLIVGGAVLAEPHEARQARGRHLAVVC